MANRGERQLCVPAVHRVEHVPKGIVTLQWRRQSVLPSPGHVTVVAQDGRFAHATAIVIALAENHRHPADLRAALWARLVVRRLVAHLDLLRLAPSTR